MIGKEETIDLLNNFFEDCFAFWVRQGKKNREAFELALNETSQVQRNPFSPMGDLIDQDAKQKYIAKMRIQS